MPTMFTCKHSVSVNNVYVYAQCVCMTMSAMVGCLQRIGLLCFCIIMSMMFERTVFHVRDF